MPKIIIRYCQRWNYKPHAARVADAIKRDLNLVAEQVVGNTGEFTVWVDGAQVASKQNDQFPKDADVVQAVRAVLNPKP